MNKRCSIAIVLALIKPNCGSEVYLFGGFLEPMQKERPTTKIQMDGRHKGSILRAENSPQYTIVQEWRKKNPKSSNKSLCVRETELSRPTSQVLEKSLEAKIKRCYDYLSS